VRRKATLRIDVILIRGTPGKLRKAWEEATLRNMRRNCETPEAFLLTTGGLELAKTY
jgi:hypothetical protein